MEFVFAVHCALPLQPPSLLPVSHRMPAELLSHARVVTGGPIFLDAEGVPVSLPDALHVGLSRYIAHALLPITGGARRLPPDMRTYQIGRTFLPWPHHSNPLRAVDHPLEVKMASFDMATASYR